MICKLVNLVNTVMKKTKGLVVITAPNHNFVLMQRGEEMNNDHDHDHDQNDGIFKHVGKGGGTQEILRIVVNESYIVLWYVCSMNLPYK